MILLFECLFFKITLDFQYSKFRHQSIIDFGQVHGELFDLSIVVLSEVDQELGVSGSHEVDGHSLSSESSGSTDSVDVLGGVGRQVVVDDQVDLLDVDSSADQVGSDQNSGRPRPELLHDVDSLAHLHITVNGRDHKLVLLKFFGQFIDSLLLVGEDNALSDDHALVKLDQGSEFLAVLFHRDVELLDTIQGQLFVLDQNLDWVLHELVGHLDDVHRHGGREEAHLNVRGQVSENQFDVLDEPSVKHLVGLVQNDDLQEICLQAFLVDHVFDSSRSSHNHLHSSFPQDSSVFLGVGASDAAVH